MAHTTETQPFFHFNKGNETDRSHEGPKLKQTATITKPDLYNRLHREGFLHFIYNVTTLPITSNFNLSWKDLFSQYLQILNYSYYYLCT